MISNFEFLKAEWPELFEAASTAEQYTFTSPQTCAFYCRYTLERTTIWIYDHDSSLKKPYQDKLAAMLYEECFKQNLGQGLFERVILIHKLGNQAVHTNMRIRETDSISALKALFALLAWLTRIYSKNPPTEILFKETLIPKAEQPDKNLRQLELLQIQLAEKDKILEEEHRQLTLQREEYQRLLEETQAIKTQNRNRPTIDYTESETRDLLIDLLLREAGWNIESRSVSVEYPVKGLPTSSGKGAVDYVLWGDDGKPLALIEAKRTKRSPFDGEKQAHIYADCLEKQTGQRPIIFFSNGDETWLWDDFFFPPRPVQGFYTKDQLQLLINRRTSRLPLKEMEIDRSIVNRPYHIEGIRRVTESFEKEKKRKALVVMATGTGKTQFSIALVKILMQANWVRRVLFLADRTVLVRQAKSKFTQYYPDVSTVNLIEERDDLNSRIVFSTYQTMMNTIDRSRDDADRASKWFGVGHFDLVIIDEAHRSIYLKYRAIFDYFDALLLGLTATPKTEVDRNTYRLFQLEDNVPTFFYELDQAVNEKYLVPHVATKVPLKFVQQGIRYNELSEQEKEEYEALFFDDATGMLPEYIEPGAVNQWLFNADTIDKVLIFLMEQGLKIEGGDRLGKTIIFARNHLHAIEIKKRFDYLFPGYRGTFAQVIDYSTDFAQVRIDDFSESIKDPMIAISVDMLDTGIDIHEIVNLVFFKIVRSRAKFWQMIGRGTRTCPGLFGPGKDKKHFIIFDFCDNFAFFDVYPEGITPSQTESLTGRIFKKRVILAHLLRSRQPGEDSDNRRLFQYLADTLHRHVQELDPRSFFVRPHRKYVEEYSERPRWDQLEISDISDIQEQLTPLISPDDPDEYSRWFDLLIVNMQIYVFENNSTKEYYIKRLRELAASLEKLGTIPAVKKHMKRIHAIRSDHFIQTITPWILEEIRRELRDLIKFIEPTKREPVFTDFVDEIGIPAKINGDYKPSEDMENYRYKMEKIIRENQNHITIYKLKHNKPITRVEFEELERLLFKDLEAANREAILEEYKNNRSLGRFIRSIVGLEREVVNEAFSQFISNPEFNADQITFINRILDYLTRNGYIERKNLMEQPFSDIHDNGLLGVFNHDQAQTIIHIIDTINENAIYPVAIGA